MFSNKSKEQILLLVGAVGLTPIALSYGVMPGKSLNFLFGIEVMDANLVHIMRAVMGLYFGMVSLWLMGFVNKSLVQPALYTMAVFMLGLAAGRTLSLALDGPVNWLLETYTLLEFGFGFLAMKFATSDHKEVTPVHVHKD